MIFNPKQPNHPRYCRCLHLLPNGKFFFVCASDYNKPFYGIRELKDDDDDDNTRAGEFVLLYGFEWEENIDSWSIFSLISVFAFIPAGDFRSVSHLIFEEWIML